MFRFLFVSIIIIFSAILAACSASTPTETQPAPSITPQDQTVKSPDDDPGTMIPEMENPYSPQEGDVSLGRSEVMLESKELLVRESFPPQYALVLKGALPTPCHQLRVANLAPDSDNQIKVEIYSVIDPNVICVQILEAFEATVELDGYPAGKYSVWVNEEKVGEMDVPDASSSMKGYELYSWQSDEDWFFALLPGTNRLKTQEEITQKEGRLAGIEDLETALKRLPKGEQVFWVTREIPGISSPVESMVEEISDYCSKIGLQLEVVSSNP